MQADPNLSGSDEELITDLLLEWESRESGSRPDVEELCRNVPHLRDQVAQKLQALRRVSFLNEAQHAVRITPWAKAQAVDSPSGRFARVGDEPIDGYRIVRFLGRGGFSEVWAADGPGDFPVALKLIPLNSETFSREERSLDLIKSIRHPRVISTFGAWRRHDFLIIAMELAEKTLADRWYECNQRGEPGIEKTELIKYLKEAAEGLDYLNENCNIQHRDVKPQNLVLVGGCAKVADFGLARLLQHDQTGHTGIMTQAYATPEFLHGHVSRQSDQYSLAVSYCKLRGGKLPFEGTSAEVINGHLRKQPDLSMLQPAERPAVKKALAKRPGDRWSNCQTFVDAVKKCVRPGISRRSVLQWAAGVTLTGGLIESTRRNMQGKIIESQSETGKKEPLGFSENTRLEELFQAKANGVFRAVVFLPGDKQAATTGNQLPQIWDLNAGQSISTIGKRGGACVAVSDQNFGAKLLLGNHGGNVELWDYISRTFVREFGKCAASVNGVAFAPDCSRILAVGYDQKIWVWNAETAELISRCQGHTANLTSATFLPTGRQVASVGWDGTLRIWDIDSTSEIRSIQAHEHKVNQICISESGKLAATCGDDRLVRIWDLQTAKMTQEFGPFVDSVKSIALDTEFQRLIVGIGNGSVEVWDVPNKRLKGKLKFKESNELTSVAISKDGNHVLAAGGALLYFRIVP